MLNKIVLMGRMTADPELKRTNGGTSVTSFTIAVDRDFKSRNGEKETDFVNCVAWRGTAEFISKHFYKGSMAVVAGSLQSHQYEKNGDKRTAWEVLVESMYFADSKKSESSQQQNDNFASLSNKVNQEFAPISEEDGELPF